MRVSWLFIIFGYPLQKFVSQQKKISDIHPTLYFTEFDLLSRYHKSFEQSELGQLHSSFPFAAFCQRIGLVDKAKGRPGYFSAEGKIALMLLKSYTGLFDSDLIDGLNSNLHFSVVLRYLD